MGVDGNFILFQGRKGHTPKKSVSFTPAERRKEYITFDQEDEMV